MKKFECNVANLMRVVFLAAVGSSEHVVEPGTNVKFPRELRVPGCSGSLILLGTGAVVTHLFHLYIIMEDCLNSTFNFSLLVNVDE